MTTDNVTVDSVLAAHLGSLESAHSRTGYRHDWETFVAWLAGERVDPLAARPSVVQCYVAFLQKEGKSKATRARALSVIRSVYDALVVNDLCQTNPARSVKNLKVGSTPRAPFLDTEGAERLLATVREVGDSWLERRDRLVLLLLFGLGLRRSEIARIKIEDFEGGALRLRYIAKGNKPATTEVPTWLQAELLTWIGKATEGALLPERNVLGKSIKDTVVYEVVKAAAKKAGFPPEAVTPHGLRRTLATIALKRGVSLRDVQLGFNHASSKTTERYNHGVDMSALAEGLADLVYGPPADKR